jgi:hypothetical protein
MMRVEEVPPRVFLGHKDEVLSLSFFGYQTSLRRCSRTPNMPDAAPSYVPSEVDLKLRLGIFRLLQAKYHPRFGARSKFLSAAIVNWALLETPGNEEAQAFWEANRDLVEEEAKNLYIDPVPALALSILYSFTLIRLGPKQPEVSMGIVERATDLNIVILSAKEIHPTDDAMQFLAFIDSYASSLLEPPRAYD